MRLARNVPLSHGLVLDYVILNTYTNNMVFQGDTTYFLSGGLVSLTGTSTFEGGAVIKYTNGGGLYLGAVNCRTSAYRPVIFTSMDDNSVGEPIMGSTGFPTNYRSSPLTFTEYQTDQLQNLRIDYANFGILAAYDNLLIKDCQFVNDLNGIKATGGSINLENVLMYNVAGIALYPLQGGAQFIAQNLTVHNANTFYDQGPFGSLCLTNSLLIACTNLGSSFNGVSNYTSLSDAGIFQTAGGGANYLAANCPPHIRDAGTTNIDPALLADLHASTTEPPDTSYVNQTISSGATALSPRGLADTNTPDLGYHYPILDYVFSQCQLNDNATLTFNPGTAVGWYGQGLALSNSATVSFDGLVASPCYFVRCNTVQELDTNGDATGITCADTNIYSFSTIQATFTRFSAAGDLAAFFDASPLYVQTCYNCEFWNGLLGGDVPNASQGLSLYLVNCLLDRSSVAFNITNASPYCVLSMQNCTLHGGSLVIDQPIQTWPATVGDSAFDGTVITVSPAGGNSYITGSHDAYLTNATILTGETGDPAAQTNFNWQMGPLGNYYLPPGSLLINAGDKAASAIPDSTGYTIYGDLGIFTTQTNQAPEGSTTVDIGYHYAAPIAASPISDSLCVNSTESPQSWDFNFSSYNSNPDAWGLPVTYLATTGPTQHGSLTDQGGGSYSYTPDQCYDGPDGFTYQMSDGLFTSPPATVTVLMADLISASYSPAPVQTPVNTPTNITLYGSDSCYQSVSFIWPATTLKGGTLTGSGSSVTYHPPANFSGIDSFEFQVANQCGQSAGAIVYIAVGTNSGTGGPFTVVTNLNGGGPIGIDYSPTENALIASVDNGDPDFQYDDFVQLGTNIAGALTVTNFSVISGLSDESKVATVKQSVNGFTNGDVFFGSDSASGVGIGWLSTNGASSNLLWCVLTNDLVTNPMPLRGALYVDQTGIFSNNIIVVTSPSTPESGNKGVWSVDAQARPKLVAQIDTQHLEGVITLPNDTSQWGPWAGKIITGDEDNDLLYTIDTNGNVAPYSLGIGSEDFDLIPTNQDLYVCDNDLPYKILKLSHTWLTNYVGDLLITQAGDGQDSLDNPKLFIVNWNGTNFVTRAVNATDFSMYHFEHVSFAPLNLPSQPIQ